MKETPTFDNLEEAILAASEDAPEQIELFTGQNSYTVDEEGNIRHATGPITPEMKKQVKNRYRQTIFNDQMFRQACVDTDTPMIEPFLPELVRNVDGTKVVSYGLSSFGYDIRVSTEFMVLSLQRTFWQKCVNFVKSIFGKGEDIVIDPKNFPKEKFKRVKVKIGEAFVIPPHSVVLAHSVEYFRMPANALGLCIGKSTYARCGLECLNTPLEPSWEGYLTLEFCNGTDLPIKMYAGEGALQLVVFRGPACDTTYSDRGGKYMKQAKEVVTPTV